MPRQTTKDLNQISKMKRKYENEHIHKQVMFDLRCVNVSIVLFLLALVLIFLSIYHTYQDIYVNGFNDSFMHRLTDEHPLGLVFGITLLILFGIWESGSPVSNSIKHFRPACGSVRYTPEEIDEQANLPESEWLLLYDIYITPKLIIGVNRGVTAVEYDDIDKIYIKRKWHTEGSGMETRSSRKNFYKSSEYYTYRIMAITKNNKRLCLSETKNSGKMPDLRNKIKEHCDRDVWPDQE